MKFSVKKNRYFRKIIFATGNHLDALTQAQSSRNESLRHSEASQLSQSLARKLHPAAHLQARSPVSLPSADELLAAHMIVVRSRCRRG
jgi:hypothetical protein